MVNAGIDLHKTQFTVCVRRQEGKKESNDFYKYPTTEEGYTAFLKQASVWQECGEEVRVAIEDAGFAHEKMVD